MSSVIKNLIISTTLPFLLLFLWQTLSTSLNNPVILPPVTSVFSILLTPTEDLLNMGSLLQNIFISLGRVLVGFILGGVIGIPIGIIMGYKKLVFTIFHYLFSLLRPIPPLAWVPLVLAWFGVASLANVFYVDSGETYLYLRNFKLSMIFIIFIGAFFPILTSTIFGVQSVQRTLIDSALILGATPQAVFTKILLPAAAPSIVNGMRIGLGVAWMCLVAAEMLPGSIAGVGYLITHAYTVARTDIVIAGMITIGFIGTLLDNIFRIIADKKFAWQHLSR